MFYIRLLVFNHVFIVKKLLLLSFVLAFLEIPFLISEFFVSLFCLQEMICAIAELESDRKPLIMRYNKKTKETGLGMLQVYAKTAEWLAGYVISVLVSVMSSSF